MRSGEAGSSLKEITDPTEGTRTARSRCAEHELIKETNASKILSIPPHVHPATVMQAESDQEEISPPPPKQNKK